MEFYASKANDLPRFIYRNFTEVLKAHPDAADRKRIVDTLVAFIAELQPGGDWQKMKWSLPPAMRSQLNEQEQAVLDEVLAKKGKRRNEKLVEVYPHCADEFSTDIAFLDATFGAARFGLISKQTKLMTIGSCFAANIARFLSGQSYNVSMFRLMEDLNSPFSNAKLLAVCAAESALRDTYISHWVKSIYPNEPGYDLKEQERLELKKLEELRSKLAGSEFIIVTCGNVLDYFIAPKSDGFDIGPAVAPKFLSIHQEEDIGTRTYTTNRLKEAGAVFRMGSYTEVVAAMDAQYAALRAINPHAHILFTLSPVPIDSALGIHHSPRIGALEMDCISKSQLRVALAERMQAWSQADAKLHYFPSFEIVRWVGACMDGKIFGEQDAASRHVSQTILSGVYRYFLHKYGEIEQAASMPQPTAQAVAFA